MKHFLGIDLGLSGARAAVLDDHGRLRGTGRCSIGFAERNAAEQDPAGWLRAIAGAVDEALSTADRPSIESVGIGAFGPCAVTLDPRLEPTGPASLFAFDTRHEPWRRRLVDEGIPEERLGPDHTLPKIERLRDTDPKRFGGTAYVLDATGYLVTALTGKPVMDPITRLDHAVDGEAPPLPLPDVRPADAIAGTMTATAAEQYGIATGTPVAVGSYDSHVDLFGAGVTCEGEAGMLLGSTAVICKVVQAARELGALRATPHIGRGTMVGGWTSSAGSLLSWAQGVTGPARTNGHDIQAPGSSGLIMLPYFAGERTPIWDMAARGALVGLTLSTTGDDIRQAALEAVALSILDIAARLDAACGPTSRYRVAGGGAAIPGLVEAIASATGATLEIVDYPGEACGGAILAAHAVGTPLDRTLERVVEPDPASTARFAALMNIYAPLYGQLADAMHRLGELASKKEH